MFGRYCEFNLLFRKAGPAARAPPAALFFYFI